ncbi:MAG: ABC transporter substrate-binding protein [SAR324 cluster bacterium]|nr:ABC transporter substrate-binding protein [SAR324 cluster bacterium]
MKNLLIVLAGIAVLALGGTAYGQIKNPNTLIYLTTDDISSLDPAYIGDTPSTYSSYNVYSRLLDYNGSNISEFVPALASQVPSVANGLIEELPGGAVRYTFPMRPGVKAHKVGIKGSDGKIKWQYFDDLSAADKAKIEPGYGEITADDARYSLMRAILQGESWMANAVTEMITAGKYSNIEKWAIGLAGVEKFDDVNEAGLIAVHDDLAKKIKVVDGKLILTLESSFPATLGIMALPFATSIVDREWAIDMGAWPDTAASWIKHHKPKLDQSPLFKQENGSGPFIVEDWNRTEKKITFKRFDGFFRKPAPLERVVLRLVPEWTNRRLQLLAGDADVAVTPPEFIEEMRKTKGITVTDLEQVYGRGLFFGWPVKADDNPAIGSGKLDGKGVPPDFLADLDVRKGFNYAQDYQVLLEQVYLGRTVQSRGPTVRGLMGYRPDSPIYTNDLEKAAEHFKKAFGGKLWEVGFEVTGYTAEGRSQAIAAFGVLQQNLARINPKFRLKVQALTSASMREKSYGSSNPESPLAYMGWGPDYSDPGGPLGAASYYLSSSGLVAGFSGDGYRALMKEKFDPLLEKAWKLNDPAQREPIYARLQEMSHEYATTQFLWEEVTANVTRDWVKGYVHNKILYGAWNFYNISKEL